VFRIKAEYSGQIEVKTTIQRAREFYGELRNFVELMPGIEEITREANGTIRWLVRAEVPILGAMRAVFSVEQTQDAPERIEWSPAPTEKMNYLRYAAAFETRGASVLVRIAQKVELQRRHARELHMLAGLVGESTISEEMQKRVAEMIKTFLRRSQAKLESCEDAI
jgi:carbon monoxide dehydrogenase subunit G